jgi:hypothetical protein
MIIQNRIMPFILKIYNIDKCESKHKHKPKIEKLRDWDVSCVEGISSIKDFLE